MGEESFCSRLTRCIYPLSLVLLPLTLYSFLIHYQGFQSQQVDDVDSKIEFPPVNPVESIIYYSVNRRTSNMSPICNKPETRVAFLKVHKAASTTVMNIFLRYGTSHNLNIVLPKPTKAFRWNYLGFGIGVDRKRIIPPPQNESYHILCNHVRYDKESFKEILGEDSLNIGIVRDPYTQFLSAAAFFGLLDQLRRTYKGITDRERISLYIKRADLSKRDDKMTYVHNRMFYDFGLDAQYFYNTSIINKVLKTLSDEFQLVMLTEYFHESLILLKRTLCWDLKDIIYVKLNKSKEKHPIILTQKERDQLFKFNQADFMLYELFKKKFLKLMEEEGGNFRNEVTHFNNIHSAISNFCNTIVNSKVQLNEVVYRTNASVWNNEFIITSADCQVMMSAENDLLEKLSKKAERRNR